MKFIRHLLFALAVLGTCSTVAAELPKRVGPSVFALALYDSHGLWGGQELFILTNGLAYARIERPPQKKESGLQERRYKIQLTTNEVQKLRMLFDQHQFLTPTITTRTGFPDEAGATISLRIVGSQRHDVFQWERDAQTGFKTIHQHLLAIVRRAEKSQPIFQGPSVYRWTPEGFDR